MKTSAKDSSWDERTSARGPLFHHSGGVFESLFERSADPIWLFDVHADHSTLLVDCNQAAVRLIGAENKQQLLNMRPEDLSPPLQPGGISSAQRAEDIVALVQREKTHRFVEWIIRRRDGRDVPTRSFCHRCDNGRQKH